MKKIAMVLSGCGNKDGSEITEAISSIISLSQFGAEVSYFAPSIDFNPKNFLTNESMAEKRNVLIESARISRSEIQDLNSLKFQNFDGLVLPGGLGASTHLSNWNLRGAHCEVIPHLKTSIQEFHNQGKPIGAICIAPVLLASVLGVHGITITLGNSKETISEILKTGAHHELCPADDYITDREHKVLTTPAYMLAAKPYEVFKGINSLIKELVEMS